jgi:hypothetical protein
VCVTRFPQWNSRIQDRDRDLHGTVKSSHAKEQTHDSLNGIIRFLSKSDDEQRGKEHCVRSSPDLETQSINEVVKKLEKLLISDMCQKHTERIRAAAPATNRTTSAACVVYRSCLDPFFVDCLFIAMQPKLLRTRRKTKEER